jgi:multisubunit Na+/H+ antiporter MnhC subunit
MNWFLLSACFIVYPLFGIGIYLVRNRLAKTKDFSIAVFAPAGISFLLGIGILVYSVSTMYP